MAKTQEQYEQEERELTRQMIKNESAWPAWPALPLKRRKPNDFPDTGFLVGGAGLKVFVGCIFTTMEKGGSVKGLPTEEFKTIDELLNAGWVVD